MAGMETVHRHPYLTAAAGVGFAALTWNLPGHIFGEVDNWVVVAGSIIGHLSAKPESKLAGSLWGAVLGNAASDFVAAYADPTTRHLSWGILSGCLVVAWFLPAVLRRLQK